MGRSKGPMLPFYDHLTELCNEADQAIRKIAYLKALIGNPIVPEKLDDSLSGLALVVAKRAVLESVILFYTRMWDEKWDDLLSICNIVKLMPSTAKVVARQIDKNNLLDEVSATAQFDRRIHDWRQQFDLLAQDPNRQSLRVFRHEWLAHRIHESQERISLGTGSTIKDLTYNDVIDQATKTVMLIGDLNHAVNRNNNLYSDRLRTDEAQFREFWRILPVLKVAENLSHQPPAPALPPDS